MFNMSTKVKLENESPTIGNTVLSDAVFRPMLFSTPMVQAILEGRKTQTRRLVKPNPRNYNENSFIDRVNYKNGNWCLKHKISSNPDSFEITDLFRTNINIGDIIWVRETFAETCDEMGTPIIAYKFGKPRIITGCNGKYELWKETNTEWSIDNYPSNGKWKPSLFMPKFVCRIFLEVTDVRIERLNEISEIDAIEEGIEVSSEFGYKLYSKKSFFSKHLSATDSYFSLWDSINGKDSWKENPFVWVYTFKVVECPNGFR